MGRKGREQLWGVRGRSESGKKDCVVRMGRESEEWEWGERENWK